MQTTQISPEQKAIEERYERIKDMVIDPDLTTTVFRIFQETLTNVARHAKASRVQIRLRAEGDEVVLEVEDNGRGITPEALSSPKSLGLLGMKERAAVLGGEVTVEPGQQGGTKVTFRLPRTASETRFWEQVQI